MKIVQISFSFFKIKIFYFIFKTLDFIELIHSSPLNTHKYGFVF
jgi:hypothetical protein